MADLEQHAARIAELVQQFEDSTDADVRERVFELLENIDHMHRTCVWRLFELTTELGGKGLIDRLTTDSTVKTLFVLYDLISTVPLQPVVSDAPVTTPFTGGFVPLGLSRVRGRQVKYQVAFAQADLPVGSLQAVEVDGIPVLLCSVEEGVFAYRNSCSGSPLPLHLGSLTNGEIHCPWHGCRYDARTGQQVSGTGFDLQPFSVELRDAMIHVSVQTAESE